MKAQQVAVLPAGVREGAPFVRQGFQRSQLLHERYDLITFIVESTGQCTEARQETLLPAFFAEIAGNEQQPLGQGRALVHVDPHQLLPRHVPAQVQQLPYALAHLRP